MFRKKRWKEVEIIELSIFIRTVFRRLYKRPKISIEFLDTFEAFVKLQRILEALPKLKKDLRKQLLFLGYFLQTFFRIPGDSRSLH